MRTTNFSFETLGPIPYWATDGDLLRSWLLNEALPLTSTNILGLVLSNDVVGRSLNWITPILFKIDSLMISLITIDPKLFTLLCHHEKTLLIVLESVWHRFGVTNLVVVSNWIFQKKKKPSFLSHGTQLFEKTWEKRPNPRLVRLEGLNVYLKTYGKGRRMKQTIITTQLYCCRQTIKLKIMVVGNQFYGEKLGVQFIQA